MLLQDDMTRGLTFTVVALFDDSPQLQEDRHGTCDISAWLAINRKRRTGTADTHKASARLAERGPLVRGFMEVVCVEVEAQLGTYGHSPHEVRGDFLTADLSLPVRKTCLFYLKCDTKK